MIAIGDAMDVDLDMLAATLPAFEGALIGAIHDRAGQAGETGED